MPQDKTSAEREMASLGMYTCIALSGSRRGRGHGDLSMTSCRCVMFGDIFARARLHDILDDTFEDPNEGIPALI